MIISENIKKNYYFRKYFARMTGGGGGGYNDYVETGNRFGDIIHL